MSDNNKVKEITTEKFRAHKQGLHVVGKPTINEWMEYGEKLRTVEASMQWIIGDYLNYGEFNYGEKYSQVLDESVATWKTYNWVSNRVPKDIRNPNLSWSHHRMVANLPREYQVKLLEKAEKESLSTRDLSLIIARVGDEMFETVKLAEVDQQERSYKKKLNKVLDEAIDAGVPVDMTSATYRKYVRRSGIGRCPHCGGKIMLSHFFETREFDHQDYVRNVRPSSALKPLSGDHSDS